MSSHTYSIARPAHERNMNRVALGIAVSVAAHCVLLFAFHYRAPAPAPDMHAARTELVVHLLAPPPPPQAAPELPKPAASATAPLATARKPAPAKARVPRPASEVIAMPAATPDQPAAQAAFTVAPPQESQQTPKFDPDAARKFARAIANKPDPARAGMAVAQIPEKPLETETKTARAIASAKRGDCKMAAGGALAPLLMLLDKKDSGCKW